MPIYQGSKEIENFMIGSTQVETIYLGDKEVWNNNAWYLYALGSNTYYNIRNLGIKYDELNADNFISLGQPSAVYGECEKVYSSTTTSNVVWDVIKSYSNGDLNFYYRAFSRNTDTSVGLNTIYLLSHQKISGARKVKDKNVVDLGLGTSFNISRIRSDYKNLNANNFYMTTAGRAYIEEGPDLSGAGPVSGTAYIYKSYDANSGILNFYNAASGPGVHNNSVRAFLVV